jgi:hypothetical protein
VFYPLLKVSKRGEEASWIYFRLALPLPRPPKEVHVARRKRRCTCEDETPKTLSIAANVVRILGTVAVVIINWFAKVHG